MSLLPGRRN